MLATSATSGPLPGVTRTGPPSFEKFWVGATNILFVFGGHAMCVEVSLCFDLGLWGGELEILWMQKLRQKSFLLSKSNS